MPSAMGMATCSPDACTLAMRMCEVACMARVELDASWSERLIPASLLQRAEKSMATMAMSAVKLSMALTTRMVVVTVVAVAGATFMLGRKPTVSGTSGRAMPVRCAFTKMGVMTVASRW